MPTFLIGAAVMHDRHKKGHTFHSAFVLELLQVNDGLLIQIASKEQIWRGVSRANQAHSCIVQLINKSDETACLVTHLPPASRSCIKHMRLSDRQADAV